MVRSGASEIFPIKHFYRTLQINPDSLRLLSGEGVSPPAADEAGLGGGETACTWPPGEAAESRWPPSIVLGGSAAIGVGEGLSACCAGDSCDLGDTGFDKAFREEPRETRPRRILLGRGTRLRRPESGAFGGRELDEEGPAPVVVEGSSGTDALSCDGTELKPWDGATGGEGGVPRAASRDAMTSDDDRPPGSPPEPVRW